MTAPHGANFIDVPQGSEEHAAALGAYWCRFHQRWWLPAPGSVLASAAQPPKPAVSAPSVT